MKNSRKRRNKDILVMILLYFIYSLMGIIGKYNAMSSEVGTMRFWVLFSIQVAGMVLFAIGWQLLLRKFDLSYVYLFKGTTILWGLLFAQIIFHEQVTGNNLVGALIIVCGIGVVLSEQ